jgi:hypothetical protein
MIGKYLVGAALAVTLAGSALAQYASEYYVVQDPTTKRCTIIDQKPTTTITVVQVGPLAFKSRNEAEEGMKTYKVCSSD